jgi:hypothetical protein
MATVEFLNKFGMIDLSLIDPNAVAELSPEQQQSLSILIDAVKTKEAAELRKSDARKRLHTTTNAEMVAMAANDAANPPPNFLDIRKAAIAAYKGEEYEAPKAKGHAKIAKAGPKIALAKCEAETIDARAELQAATVHARRCEIIEGDCMASWISVNRPPSASDVHRKMLADDMARKLARVAEGKSPTEKPTPTHDQSPLGVAAFNRGRAGTRNPLRSNVTRR